MALIAAKSSEKQFFEEEEEEEEGGDLFEINLEIVNKIPPPQHYWERCFTATTNTLFANCLLSIAAVSSSVPAAARGCDALFPWSSKESSSSLQTREMKV
ncbi:hypothetical protein CDL12_10533 [Handroanthus impetiginosus]|uniref:Uncharacterized protein n=1 Tax=Handroanthus impetiginosus TaxID=429701 RepID=A0A2G9HH02_9LAMI|nr:hypothetical protein CDL12_10533 [Handroanthus impetiginosus]